VTTDYWCGCDCCVKALIGVAFSVGFIVGPLIGAYFSQQAHLAEVSDAFFRSPALFALTLAVLNVIFLGVCLQETLPADRRVGLCVSLLFPNNPTISVCIAA